MRGFTPKDLYALTLVALRHPDSAQCEVDFWRRIVEQLGSHFFGNKTVEELVAKFKQLKEQVGKTLREYNQALGKVLDPQLAKDMYNEIFIKPQTGISAEEIEIKKREEEEKARASTKARYPDGKSFLTADVNLAKHKAYFSLPNALNIEKLQGMSPKRIKLQENTDNADLEALRVTGTEELLQKKIEEAKFFMVAKKGRSVGIADMRQFEGFPVDLPDFSLPRIIEALSGKYSVPSDRVCLLLGQLNGSLSELEKFLQGEKVTIWTELEDLALLHPDDKAMYQCLVLRKGEIETAKRINYLKMFSVAS